MLVIDKLYVPNVLRNGRIFNSEVSAVQSTSGNSGSSSISLDSKADIESPTFTGTITTPFIASPSYTIANSSGAIKWTVSVDSSDNLQFKNSAGVVEAVLTQTGNLSVKGELTAFATI